MIKSWIQRLYIKHQRPLMLNFFRSTKNPEEIQLSILKTLIAQNESTKYGSLYKFSKINSYQAYTKSVPIVDYDDIKGFIQLAADREPTALSNSKIRIFEETSGTTQANKLIPFTEKYLQELSAANMAWLCDLYENHPRLYGQKVYWSVSPLFRPPTCTPSGIPIGMQNDSEYLGPIGAHLANMYNAVPSEMAYLTDHERWRQMTALSLMQNSKKIGLISVWSPSFLTMLMKELKSNFQWYKRHSASNCEDIGELFPNLNLISCWNHGPSAQQALELKEYFPNTQLQGKGLIATEGVVSVPLFSAPDPVTAITSHFLEFEDLHDQKIMPCHDLKVGGRYTPILTTGSGFFRYRLKDIVECTGHLNSTPTLKFVAKLEQVADLCGEKVSAEQVYFITNKLCDEFNSALHFSMIGPLSEKKRYCFVYDAPTELDARLLTDFIERELSRNIHYKQCRQLKQLAPVQIVFRPDAQSAVRNHLQQSSTAIGNQKASLIDVDGKILDTLLRPRYNNPDFNLKPRKSIAEQSS